VDPGRDREDVYLKHADDLTRFATGLVGPDSAADLVSEAMLRCLWRPDWESVANQRAYLFRAVLNEARMARRHDERRRRRESATAHREAHTGEPEVRPEVLDAIRSLSIRQRAVVVLTYWADLPPLDIADLLGISEGAVRRHLARARQHLREVLND
jgi:RNA polymerase sigma-70 factor (ECF subfamily)